MIKYYIFLTSSLALNATSYVFYKQSSLNSHRQILSVILLTAGLILGAANATLYTKSLSGIPLSTAYPIFSAGSLILVSIISVMMFGETMSIQKIVGIVVLTVGVVLVAT